ncbi:MAG: 50S ribosomal protein L10 [candidate division WOR-3 bacterium]
MPKEEKVKFIEDLQSKIKAATALYFLDFSGLPANDFNEFRRSAREQNMMVKVVKNQLALRALKASGVPDGIDQVLRGPTSMIFAVDDPVAPARFLKDMGKRIPNIRFKGAYLENTVYTAEQFDLLANLPTKQDLRAELVGVLAGPISGLAGVLEGMLAELVWVLEQLEQKKSTVSGS